MKLKYSKKGSRNGEWTQDVERGNASRKRDVEIKVGQFQWEVGS